MKTTHPLQFFSSVENAELPLSTLNNLTDKIYSSEHIKKQRKFNLVCCSDYRIRKLNSEYRDKDKVTDVLSFPFEDEDFLGEIYISIKRTEIQARLYRVTFNEEFLRLFIHGLLHLAGYDHIKENERIVMEKRECFYLDYLKHKDRKLFTV